MAPSTSSISEIVAKLNSKLEKNPSLMEGYNCVYFFKIGANEWTLDLKTPSPHRLVEGKGSTAPDCSIEVSEENFAKLLKGELMIPLALVMGRIKLSGEKLLATKLVKLFERN